MRKSLPRANSVEFVETRLRLDDPVGAISVHGVCGAWGVMAVGLFANGRYGDGWNSVAGNAVIGLFTPHRAALADQITGLDGPELGILGYQPDVETQQ